MAVLVIAEHNGKKLAPSTLTVLTAAQECGGDVAVLVAGEDVSQVSTQATNIKGVNQVLYVNNVLYKHALAEEMALLIQSIASEFSHIIAPATTFGKNILPRVAALLDVQMLSDVTKIITSDTFERPMYAGNAIATIKSLDKQKVLTIRPTAFEKAEEMGSNAQKKEISAQPQFGKSEFVSAQNSDPLKPQLTTARVVVAGGRGLKDKDNFKMLEELASKLGGGAIGASRAAVDVGWVPNDYQVGQTGKVVAPDLYIAVGISGAIQHLAGMKDSKVIVAINQDENAPIFEVATYGLVADLFEAVPALIKELS